MATLCCRIAQLRVHLPDQYFRRLIGGQAAGVSVGEPHRVPVGKLAATFQSEAAVGDEQMQEGCAGQADRSAGPQPRAVQRGAAVMQGERCVLPGYARRDGYQAGAQQFVVYLLLLVAGSDAGCIGYYPHLHEMHRLITVVSGKGGVGVTTMAACIGGVFRECRPENVIAIDAVPSFGTLADRIDESPPGDYAAIINDTDVQGYADIREHLGQNTVGLDVLAGNRTSDQPRPLVPAMFSAVLSRLRRTHTVIVIDTSPDLEHDVMKAVLQSTDTLVFVSGITADRSRPVLRAVDYLRAQGYHELVSRSTVILNHTDSITDKDALAYLTERFTKVGAIVEAMPFDPHLAKGGIIDTVHELNKKSRLRLFEITAGLADKYVPDAERAAQ